jgi:hypothetical protein
MDSRYRPASPELIIDPAITRALPYAVMVAVAIVTSLLALLGRAVTPRDEARLIGWLDWQALKAQRQYDGELSALRSDVDELAKALERYPDPVTASLLAERIANRHRAGVPMLAAQREAVLEAADSVRLWAQSGVGREEAVAAVEAAATLLAGRP